MSVTTAAATASPRPLRTSCDSCRRRKLKCSGESTGCSTCTRDRRECFYSERGAMGRPRNKAAEGSSTNPPRKRAKKSSEMLQQPSASHTIHTPSSAQTPRFDYLLGAVGMASQQQQQYIPPLARNMPNQQFNYSKMSTSSIHGFSPSKSVSTSAIDPMLESFDMTRPTPPEDNFFDVSKCLVNQPNNYVSQHSAPSYSITPQGHDSYDERSFTPVSSTANSYNQNSRTQPPNISSTSTHPLLPCACLANHYLITSKIQASSSSPSTTSIDVPERIRLYRDALETAQTILDCNTCMKSQITGVHNVFQVISLLNTLILAYKKLLDDVAMEVDAAEKERRMKSFRFVELDSNMSNEPAGMEIALSPGEWQRLILSVLRKDIYTSLAQKDSWQPQHAHLTLESIIVAMEARQQHIHATNEPVIKCAHNEFTCLKLLDQVKGGIASLELTRE